MSTEITLKLRGLGLSDREAQLYIKGLSLGPTSIQQLADAVRAKRTTIYTDMDRLLEIGLFVIDIKDIKKQYVAAHPRKLQELVSKEKELITKKEKLVEQLIPELKPIFSRPATKARLRYLEGIDGLWTLIEELVDTGSDVRSIGSSKLLFSLINRQEFEDRYIKPQRDKGHKSYFITDHYRPALKEFYGNLSVGDYRFLTDTIETPAFLVIYRDKVALANLRSEIYAVIIESVEMAEMQHLMFDFMWRSLEGRNLPKLG